MNRSTARAGLLALTLAVLPGCFTTLTSPANLDPAILATWDDGDYATVLHQHVDDDGRVDYATLATFREPLDRFVARLAAQGPATRPELFPTRADRLAYHINAYNALVLFNVLHRYPLASVHDELLDFFYFTCFPLDGEELDLYDLENDVVRERYHDPRVHFALNCASVGCPRLPREPFRGEVLEQQLERETARFLAEPRNVAVEDGHLVLSSIFEWYAEDFPPDPVSWIAARVPDLPTGLPVRYRPYDWSLNAQR